jgi:murein DD-endopeptidase MepM/ murein hydrolase activator NlpD
MVARTPITPEEQDKAYSPISDDSKWRDIYRRNPSENDSVSQQLDRYENDAGAASDDGFSKDIARDEELGGSQWKTLYQRQDPTSTKRKLTAKGLKKKGPIAAIIALLVGGGFVGFTFLTPGLLILHVTETITDRLNMQNPSMDKRYEKILARKLSVDATTGFCKGPVSINCEITSMSDDEAKRFEDAGFKIISEEKTITGRRKITKLKFNDTEIEASNLSKVLRSDPEIHAAFREAYNPKFAGFADKTWAKFASLFKLSKSAVFKGATTDEERTKTVEDMTKNGQNAGEATKYIADENGKYHDSDGNEITADEAAAHNKAVDDANLVKNGVDKIGQSGEKTTDKILTSAEDALENPTDEELGGLRTSAGKLVGLTAIPDSVCSFYGFMRAVSYGAKTIRAVQMARYAWIFLNTASMIKAGDASPEDVAYLGNVLTKIVNIKTTDSSGKTVVTTSKAATDSYGYKHMAYGDKGPLTISATGFLAGGGLGGKMTGVTDQVFSYIGGPDKAKSLCKTIKNPWVQGASAIGGIALLFTGPVGWGVELAKLAGSAAVMQAVSAARSVFTPMLADMIAGVLVDNNTFGEAAGDALVSGAGSMMSSLAGMGGNAPLHPDEAVAYTNLQNKVLAEQAEEDRLTYSPLDPSSPNTFMGKIFTQLIPYTGQAPSLTNYATTTASIVTRSFSSILNPSAFADSTAGDYTQCQDIDYREINLATDPFCNPIRGIPPEYLDADPLEVTNRLIAKGDLDESSGAPKGNYEKFITNCINRDRPLGDTGENFDQDDGHECFINKDNADYYIHQIDSRVLDGMENGYVNEVGDGSDCVDGGAQISQADLKKLVASYGLPDPDPAGAQKLFDHLKSNPDATWAAKSLLTGEKQYKAKGGDIKEYLTTAWIWAETGSDAWPDPYEMNCQNQSESTLATSFCGSGDFQAAGYQPHDVQSKFEEVYNKLYSPGDLPSVMQKVIENSSKASRRIWDYNDPSQQQSGNAGYIKNLSGITLGDLWPKTGYSDPKAQIQSLILGKDPAMAAGLNSFAVSDSDLIANGFKGGGYGYINSAYKQMVSNMIMALYMLDSDDGTASGVGCTSAAVAHGTGKGIAAIFGGTGVPSVTQEFGPTAFSAGAGASMYGYATEYGMNPPGHTGVDYGIGLDGKLYSPVDGTVEIAGGTPYFRSTDRLDGNGVSLPGTGELLIRLSNKDALVLGHMHKIEVKVGDHVTAGQYVGLSGEENGPHVHVEYRIPDSSTVSGERLVDPRDYLK